MIPAPSLQSITDRLSQQLPRRITIEKREPIHENGFMTTFQTNQSIRYQTVRIKESRNSKLVGILFCHPKTPLAKTEIVDQLPHFHERSGEAVDFFCAGYGAYWPPQHFADQKVVTSINGEKWLFSEKAFSQVIDELETETQWIYSGETELILVNAVKKNSDEAELDFHSAIVCNLEVMFQAKAFTSVRAFFTDIFLYAKTHSENDPTWGLSDSKGLSVGNSALLEAVLSLLPKSLSDAYRSGKHYAVRNIARNL